MCSQHLQLKRVDLESLTHKKKKKKNTSGRETTLFFFMRPKGEIYWATKNVKLSKQLKRG